VLTFLHSRTHVESSPDYRRVAAECQERRGKESRGQGIKGSSGRQGRDFSTSVEMTRAGRGGQPIIGSVGPGGSGTPSVLVRLESPLRFRTLDLGTHRRHEDGRGLTGERRLVE
jgi:hypothetical protein